MNECEARRERDGRREQGARQIGRLNGFARDPDAFPGSGPQMGREKSPRACCECRAAAARAVVAR